MDLAFSEFRESYNDECISRKKKYWSDSEKLQQNPNFIVLILR